MKTLVYTEPGLLEYAEHNAKNYRESDEAGFITGNDYPIDGGFIKLNN